MMDRKKLLELAKRQNLNSKQKRKILIQLVELYVRAGYDISDLIGFPLHRFCYKGLIYEIEKIENELKVNEI